METLGFAYRINKAVGNTPAKARLIRAKTNGIRDVGTQDAASVSAAIEPLKNLSKPMSVILDADPLEFLEASQSLEDLFSKSYTLSYIEQLNNLIQTNITDPVMCSKLSTGLIVGAVLIMKTVLTLPKLMKQNSLALDAKNFIARAEKTFDFIDELTQLGLNDISDIELFMLKGDIPHYDIASTCKDLIELCIPSPQVIKSVLLLRDQINNRLKQVRDIAILERPSSFKPELFKFTRDGHLTLTESALTKFTERLNEEFKDYRELTRTLLALIKPDLPPYQYAYYGCPARSVIVELTNQETGEKEAMNLIKALHLSFMKTLRSLPTETLDHYIRAAAA